MWYSVIVEYSPLRFFKRFPGAGGSDRKPLLSIPEEFRSMRLLTGPRKAGEHTIIPNDNRRYKG